MQDRNSRSSLLVRCSGEEAKTIREAAKNERRTLSGYILYAVMSRINNETERERERERDEL
jgi:uncharacterized protein (DUF1778 family)